MGINRNIVECKVVTSQVLTSADIVLIETLWNVKNSIRKLSTYLMEVLIETLWNVKKNEGISTH